MKDTMKHIVRAFFLLATLAAGPLMSAAASAQPGTPAQGTDLSRVPVVKGELPPFPYISAPPSSKRVIKDRVNDFDQAYMIIGRELRAVEGRVMLRDISHSATGLSALASQRNHDTAIRALGAVKVDAVDIDDAEFRKANGGHAAIRKKLGMTGTHASYDAYLLRTPGKNIWFSIYVSRTETELTIVEEQPMEQTVGLVTADTMSAALRRDGRVALYINFDTDKSSIRADGGQVVNEIVALLHKERKLRLSIEGHTDDVGQARRNQELSQQRADAVMAAVAARGIDRARLAAVGHGASIPLADNGTDEGRARNRRVELVKL